MPIIGITLLTTLVSCGTRTTPYDASGTFEAVETIISAEASGTIREFAVTEGQLLHQGSPVGYIDSLQLFLRRKQLKAQVNAVLSRKPDARKQLAALYAQLTHAKNEQQRIARLLKADAATQKQYDDATSQVNVIERQLEGQQSTLSTTTAGITEDVLPLQAQIEQLDDQLQKCRIVNPLEGTVLTKYVEPFEVATPGKPLYKIADLSTLTLRAYVTGTQLPAIRIGQAVRVFTDAPDGKSAESAGPVEWISDKAEFTPKTIQTKDERANLVYPVKIRVPNDGGLKIGMYGEVTF